MATEKTNLTAPEELVGINTVAEDTETTTQAPHSAAEDCQNAETNDENTTLTEEETSEREIESISDNITDLGEEELVALFTEELASKPVQRLRPVVEAIKITFNKRRRAAVEAERKAFVEAGGNEEEFSPAASSTEERFKALLAEYRTARDKYIAEQEASKEENLRIKLQIIEELKELIGSDETMNTTFQRFRELQQRWKEAGLVPQQNVEDLWETYNL